ncbi:lytR cell envelope-related transcriptional attenuator family protein [Mycobacterium xenopi 4042]|uniref:LytR cell envelope-related transcriptional attenuator family protein n=1 Tax=Mycobacterium xenopi 4042 TaxID=1299334 RepID=X7ZXP2_MYCXE|nr:lytR cell envelope-related transcriptional attenuator family protein [Mycobacterium xenopi 4042]
MSSLLRSLISNETFFSLSRLNNVVNMFISESYVDNVKTKDLVDLGQSVQGLTAGHITFVTVPTTGETDENGNEPPRTADMRALFDAIINDDPLPKENDQNATSTPTTRSTTSTAPQPNPATEVRAERVQAVTATPQEVTVQVSNSTGKTGLAATATNELRHYGFQVMAPDDYPASLKGTTVFFSPGNEQAAATVAATLPNSKVERITGIGQVVQVVLGPISAPCQLRRPGLVGQCRNRSWCWQPTDQTPGRLDGDQRRRHQLQITTGKFAQSGTRKWAFTANSCLP